MTGRRAPFEHGPRPRATALGLGLAALLCGCGPRLVDACEERGVGNQTCVGLQVTGALGDLERLAVAVQGDWVGYAEATQRDPFSLPVALAVALPPTFRGKVRIAVTAFRASFAVGSGAVVVADLKAGEHRAVSLPLQGTPAADLGAPDLARRD